jgi:hypothetical protein
MNLMKPKALLFSDLASFHFKWPLARRSRLVVLLATALALLALTSIALGHPAKPPFDVL